MGAGSQQTGSAPKSRHSLTKLLAEQFAATFLPTYLAVISHKPGAKEIGRME
jgi:hypothetical protein